MTHVNCPKCGERLDLPPIQETQGVRCPACKHEFVVSPPSQPQPLPTNDTGNTYTARHPEDLAPQQPQSTDRVYGGIRRLPYFGIMMGLGIIHGLVLTVNGMRETGFGFVIVAFTVVCFRVKNIGMNPRWCLLALIPGVGALVGIPCLVFQEAYNDTKKLDTAGKVIAYILLGLLVVPLAAVIIWAVA